MTKEEKFALVDELTETFSNTPFFYLLDASGMTVADVNKFRQACFAKGLKYQVAKNSLIKKALERIEGHYAELDGSLKGFTGVVFSPEAAKIPAEVLKSFKKDNGTEKPLLKAASIEAGFFFGEESLDVLSKIKSREELIGEIVGLLQSPAKNVVSALQSGGQNISGILKTLFEREA